jgi:glycosyltransferase involved in cell wall biosynthesis
MVGFLIKTWPKLSETFILEEVLGLERLGQPLHLFALNPPTDAIAHDDVSRVRSPVTYLDAGDGLDLREELARHARLAAAAPLAWLRGAARALLRREGGRWKDFVRAGRLADAMRRHGLAHLHAHFIAEPAGVAEIGAAMAGATFSISAHAKDIYLSKDATLQRKLDRAAFTVTCTDYNCQHLGRLAPGASVCRMYHGIDFTRFRPDLRDETAGESPLLLAVGRLREKKGFATLVDACALLRERGVEYRCEIVGYGEQEPVLREQIASLGLSNRIRLTGKLAREDVIHRYARARVFVMPSQLGADGDRDGIPNVLLEAMAMEVPVVSTHVSGIPELVRDGDTGLLVEPTHAKALADAVQRLLDDPELAARLARRGRQAVAQSFDNDRNLKTLRDLLDNHTARAAASGGARATVLNHVR